ncbi:hypothetical protein, partial [Aminobacter ciceronei]|uniref:hypothetical protein n=1 Tax=Aminobacter ciceronei TaxID=150723 RepID=UPI003606FF19
EVHLHDLERLSGSNGNGGAGFHSDRPYFYSEEKLLSARFQVLPPQATGKATPERRRTTVGMILHKRFPTRPLAGWTWWLAWPNMATEFPGKWQTIRCRVTGSHAIP